MLKKSNIKNKTKPSFFLSHLQSLNLNTQKKKEIKKQTGVEKCIKNYL